MSDTIEDLERSYRESGPEYVDPTESARLIRPRLKAAFPGVTFRVRTSKYAGGSSIRVDWTDGPTTKQVDAIVSAYKGGGFDGSIDLAYSSYSWLAPDGSASFAHTQGTEGSRGSVPGVEGSRHHPEARLVRFMADYIFTQRECSPDFLAAIEPEVPVNVEDFERDQWRWRITQRFEFTGGRLIEHDPYA
jgi:hypothetical protein